MRKERRPGTPILGGPRERRLPKATHATCAFLTRDFQPSSLLVFVFVEIRRVPLVSFTNGREALRSIQCTNVLRSMLVHNFSPQHDTRAAIPSPPPV